MTRRIRNFINFFCILLVFIANYGYSKVCPGTSNGLSIKTSTDVGVYIREYSNCTVILNNVELSFFKGQHPDTSFLDSIEEVKGHILFVGNHFENLTMRSLKVVRGNYLFDRDSSIYVEGNRKLRRIVFPSLKEIVKGNVLIENNPLLCFVKTIKWEDIFYEPQKSRVSFEGTDRACGKCSGSCDSCWSEDECQQLRRGLCHERCQTGCLEDQPDVCCHEECVVGCINATDNCVACRNFNNSGTCVARCPPHTTYDAFLNVVHNPDGKFYYMNTCVDKCPNSTVQHQGSCITNCPLNYHVINNTCVECREEMDCPKICVATEHLTTENLPGFANCTVIQGHLQILNSMKAEDLKPHLHQFSRVREITGFLLVQGLGEEIEDLSFFKNLRVIRGQRMHMAKNTALNILRTQLRSLNLPNLERIENDRVVIFENNRLESLKLPSLKYVHGDHAKAINIRKNPQLCFVTNETFNDISDPRKSVLVNENRDEEQCKQEGKVCHEECLGGCWGSGNKQCRSCRNFDFQGECLSSCEEYPNLFEYNQECKKCDPQCLDGCYGEGPSMCKKCLNMKEGSTCVERCPGSKYPDPKDKTCQDCHKFCKNGCTGPLHVLGEGGCNNCQLLRSRSNECMDGNERCERGTYEKYESMQVRDVLGHQVFDVVKICSDCHRQCKTCTGAGSSSSVCKCISVEYEGTCIEHCPSQHFKDLNNACQSCHPECDNCVGPDENECGTCKHVRLYLDDLWNVTGNRTTIELRGKVERYENTKNESIYSSGGKSLHNENEEFICLEACPDHVPFYADVIVHDTISQKEVTQRICQEKGGSLESSREQASKILVGSLVFAGILILLVAMVILGVLRAQKAKSEEIKAKLQAKIEGLNEEEILSPTNAKPDLSNLILIKESELERREEIGSGAFGTVYRGIWRPEGEKVRVAVAIKILTEESSSAQHKELLEEARVMASVSHPCCIRILAVCLSRQMMLITPLVAHGSLLTYIRKNGSSLSSLILLRWATQIAKGMAYLEQKGIVHRDLAARNILVQNLGQIKITDFGLAKLLNVDEEQFLATSGKLPMKWLALESIQHRIFTHKSDVWSYGVTLWELFTQGRRPYENISAVDIADHLEMGERLSQPSICTIDVYMVMIKCWMIDSDSRPTFLELEGTFREMSKDPDRFLVIKGNSLLRMSSELTEENRACVIRQMNLEDEEDLICGEDYLCPATLSSCTHDVSLGSQDYLEEQNLGPKGTEFAYLEAALQANKTKNIDHYNAEPGSIKMPKPPSLDETDIMKIEQKAKEETKEDYLEPTQGNNYLEMKTPAPELKPDVMEQQPSFGQKGILNGSIRDRSEDITFVSYSKLKE